MTATYMDQRRLGEPGGEADRPPERLPSARPRERAPMNSRFERREFGSSARRRNRDLLQKLTEGRLSGRVARGDERWKSLRARCFRHERRELAGRRPW